MSKLVTNYNRLNTVEQLLESITERANTEYYLFVANHRPQTTTVLDPLYDKQRTYVDAYREMIFGKRVGGDDAKLMIRNIPYQSNVVYSRYDGDNNSLLSEDFFVVVDAVSFKHVFKCLDNNNDATSTVEPDIAHISGANTYLYETSDGYRWKYMYSVDQATSLLFQTPNFFPVVPNTSVSDVATDGSVDIVIVDGAGRGYDNYSSGTFTGADIKVDGDATIYGLSNTSGGPASAVNGFYTGCSLYISSGTGEGEYRTVTNYYSNADGRYMVVNTAFGVTPDAMSEYEVRPTVTVIGDGAETNTAIARGLVNALASNSIYRVEVLNRGLGYQYLAGNVVANSVVGVESTAVVRPVYGPYRGHGFYPAAELGSRHLCFSVKVSNNEGDTILTDNNFQQVGMLRDPRFANVSCEMSSTNGTFIVGEEAYEIDPVRLEEGATVSNLNGEVNVAGADFENQFSVGDWIYVKTDTDLQHMITTVASITNSSQLIMSQNCYFACSAAVVYQANVGATAEILGSNTTHVRLTTVLGQMVANDTFIGLQSGARGIISTISRNGTNKEYETFVNLYKYEGTLTSGAFEENEIIYQGNSIAVSNALLHSSNVDGATLTVYTSNQVGQFAADGSNVITGDTSGALATFSAAWQPELVFDSGDIIYLQNIQEIGRSANTNETFQIIFEY